jgi:hypothetical protein
MSTDHSRFFFRQLDRSSDPPKDVGDHIDMQPWANAITPTRNLNTAFGNVRRLDPVLQAPHGFPRQVGLSSLRRLVCIGPAYECRRCPIGRKRQILAPVVISSLRRAMVAYATHSGTFSRSAHIPFPPVSRNSFISALPSRAAALGSGMLAAPA